MIEQTQYRAPNGALFHLVSLTNRYGMRVQFLDYGATWISAQVPVGGELREVLLGCQIDDYPRQNVYLGASVGRYANRIANAQFELNGERVQLTPNQGAHQLHGGADGFDKRIWQIVETGENSLGMDENGAERSENFVIFQLFSADGDQGFPGNLSVSVRYCLTDENELKVDYRANCDKDTALNLTNHAYFNLENAENGDVRQHLLRLNADFFLPVDTQGIPNAPLKHVVGTSFDFRLAKPIAQDFGKDEQTATKGYDHSFIVNKAWAKPCVQLTAPNGDLRLEIYTSQAALQVYSGNYLATTPNRQGATYSDFAGIAFETQCLPDTPNHPEWKNYGGILKNGENYHQWTTFRFIDESEK